MNQRMHTAALIRAAQAEFEQEIAPGLTGRQRYSGAMLRRALGVLLREQEQPFPERSSRALLASAYGADASDPESGYDLDTLAKDIRARRIKHSPVLVQALMTYVHNQLQINNPGFLPETLSEASDQADPSGDTQ